MKHISFYSIFFLSLFSSMGFAVTQFNPHEGLREITTKVVVPDLCDTLSKVSLIEPSVNEILASAYEILEDTSDTQTRVISIEQSVNETLDKACVIDSKVEVVCSKVDVVCSKVEVIDNNLEVLTESHLDHAATTLEGIGSLADGIYATMSQIDSTSGNINSNLDELDVMLESVGSKVCAVELSVIDVMHTTSDILDDTSDTQTRVVSIEQSVNEILDKVCDLDDCLPISLFDADVPLTLSVAGSNYCLAENVTGNITISAADVTLDLNDHAVTGRIVVTGSGDRAIIKNGKVTSPAPANNTIADAGAVEIQSGVEKARIINCCIIPTDTAAVNVNGSTGINNSASNIIIEKCFIQGGMSGARSSIVAMASSGGIAISSLGSTRIIESELIGGNAPNLSSANALVSIATNKGGIGLQISGDDSCVQKCKIFGGNSGSISSDVSIYNADVEEGGDGLVFSSGSVLSISESIIEGGSSNFITSPSVGVAGVFGAIIEIKNGGCGILSLGDNLFIKDCSIKGGNSGNITAGTSDIGTGFVGTSILNGGKGIVANGSFTHVIESDVFGGDCGSITASLGFVRGIFIGTAGIGISIEGDFSKINLCNVFSGKSGNLLAESASPGEVSFGTDNFAALDDAGTCTCVLDSKIIGGEGSSMSLTASVFGGVSPNLKPGADGVFVRGEGLLICNCIIKSGNGGDNSRVGVGTAGTPGRGGHGISIENASDTKIRSVQIVSTGKGGDGSVSGGDGGHGIQIGSGSLNTEVSNSSIIHTGSAGSGGGGFGGKAINDTVATSVIYGNFAHNIANTTEYTLGASAARDAVTNGTSFLATLAGTDNYLNVHKP